MSGSHLSKDFFELVKAIGESKSKQEEDRIIMHEVGVLKKKMPEANVAREKMKEFLVRMIYVEMLGHDASFAYIKVWRCFECAFASFVVSSGCFFNRADGSLRRVFAFPSPSHSMVSFGIGFVAVAVVVVCCRC